jgi:ABC-type nitrate/sulfonate/bicarbonate transport system ATPase subunit
VTKKFGEVYAVNKFDAVIRDGEFVSILGPSGCGKTTMLRMIAGFEKATDGEIAIGDQVVSKAGNGIFVPPENATSAWCSVLRGLAAHERVRQRGLSAEDPESADGGTQGTHQQGVGAGPP